MRAVTIAIRLMATVGCGDSTPSDNTGGFGGDAGAGGAGGFAGEGGAGGEGGAEPDFDELVQCYSYPEGSRTQRYVVQTEPGDVVTYTRCHAYLEENGEMVERRLGSDDGGETWTEVAEGNEVVVFCSDSLADDDGVVYYREGFEEVYVRVEAGSGYEQVVCDEVEVIDLGEGLYTRYLKAVYPGVEEGSATFRFCDIWSLNNVQCQDSVGDRCTEGTRPSSGFYKDGDLHVVCSQLDVYDDGTWLEIGADRIYVRFGQGEEQ